MNDDILETLSRRRREVKKVDQENEKSSRPKEKRKSKKVLNEIELQQENTADDVSQMTNTETNQNDMTSILTIKHRNTSRELSKQIDNYDPNNVVEEIHDVKDRIKEKLKSFIKDDGDTEAETMLNLDKDTTVSKIESELENGPSTVRSRPTSSPDLSETKRKRIERKMRKELNIKETLQQTYQEETERSYRVLNSFRRRDRATRFDTDAETDGQRTERQDREAQYTARKSFRNLIDTVVASEIRPPTTDDKFDFFCKKWDADDMASVEKLEKIEREIAVGSSSNADVEAQIDEKTELLETFKDDDGRSTVYVKSQYVPHEEQKTKENVQYFIPSTYDVPLKRKLGEQAEVPRYLEEEGYYVGKKPYVTRANKNRMEDRLTREAQSLNKWFGLDGDLVRLSDPIKYVATRPSVPVTFDPFIETEFKQPIQRNFNTNKIDGSTEASLGKYRIDIDINQIEFTYHHLFSEEHVLSFRLKNLVRNFKMSEDQSRMQILSLKLKALKDAEDSLKKSLEQSVIGRDQSQKEMNDLQRLNAYRIEIQNTRHERDKEMRLTKNLIENIVQTWKNIKEVRAKQNFRTTDVKLIIKKKNTDKMAEEDDLNREIREEFEERKQIARDEHEKAMNEYNEKNKAWKLQKTRKKEAEKRQEQRREESQQHDAKLKALLDETKERDELTLVEDELQKPEKPNECKDDELRHEIEQKYQEIYKSPGHPHLSFELQNEMNITPIEQCSVTEKIRRDVLQKTKIYVKIFLNGKLLNTTNKVSLSNDFTIYWGQIFNSYMIYWPESIQLQVWETTGSKDMKISEISLPIPPLTSNSSNIELEKYEFASPNEYFMQTKLNNALEHYTQSGVLTTGAAWGLDKDGRVLAPPRIENTNYLSKMLQNYDAITALGVSRMQDANQLAKWIMRSNLDPNDPRNADLINLIKTLSGFDTRSNLPAIENLDLPTWFRLDQLISEFNFLRDDEQLKKFENSRRFKLIELRAREEPEFKSYKMIPLLERQIPNDLINLYEERRTKEKSFDEAKDENEIELFRLKGKKLIQKIRENIFKKFRYAQHKKTLTDMIIEETIPNLTVLGSLFWSFYIEPRRPLYPSRKERKRITGQNVVPEDVHIIITIGTAYDLPIRKEKASNDPVKVVLDSLIGKPTKMHEKINGESLLNPYVEVSFQKFTSRTIAGDGPNSSWNQEIKLKLNAPNNDFTPSSLQTCTDIIYINVYDEIEIDVLQDDRDRDKVIHKKIQRNWIGCIRIPFSSLYFNSRIDGTFKLEVPPLLLGYSRDTKLAKLKTYSAIENLFNYDSPNKDASYLSVYATIEPSLLVPEAFNQSFDSNENFDLLELSSKWCADLTKTFPTREFQTTVMDTQGKAVFITKYFKGIRPPEELIENSLDTSFETAQNVARFVSLIPHVSDTLLFPGLCDIWNTCDQFMEALSGDDEEHAVLLTNFFLGLGKKAWLLIGSAITGGSSAFCLSEEQNDLNIWFNGKPYKIKEPHNPVKRISMIVNAENIWANVQSFDEPFRMQFDLKNERCWKPFFTSKTLTNTFQSLQPDSIRYTKTNQRSVKDLESKLENKLKDKIKEWRARFITRWNRNASTALSKILPQLERSRGETINTEPEELQQILSSYTMSGFPINLPYTDVNSIVDTIYATQIHEVSTSDVEFALAVYIYPYPNTVLSVWVYIASLTRKK